MGLYLCCVCCITNQTANYLENSVIIFSSLSTLSFILCFAYLPWDYIRKSGKALLIVDFILLLYALATVIYFKILRHKKIINTTRNYLANILSKIMFGVIGVGLFICLISEIIIMNDLRNKVNKEIIDLYYNTQEPESPINSTHYTIAGFGLSVIEIMWVLSLIFWIIENKLISLKIDGNYSQYINRSIQQPVQIVNNNGLVYVGNDEFGRPIYAQPAIIAQPIDMQQNAYPGNMNNQSYQINNGSDNMGYNKEYNAGHVQNFGSAAELDGRNNIPNPLDQDVAHGVSEKPNF